MATNPYQNIYQGWDPRTGMPRKRKQNPYQNVTPGFGPPQQGPGGGGDSSGGPQYPGQISTPGYTPDYKTLIQQALAPLNAQLGAEGSADTASRNAALIRGLGQFGEQFDPSSAQAAFGQDFYQQAGLEGILGQANQLAGQNTQAGFSVSAKLKEALAKSVQQIQDSLASRGLLRSGAYGTALAGANKEFGQGQYDARQSLTDYLSSAQQGYVAGERQRQQQLIEAQRAEAERQVKLNPPQGTAQAQLAGTDPVTGEPFYITPDGRRVKADGSPYVPSAAAAQTPGGEAGGQTQPADILAALRRRSQDQRLGF